MNRSKISFVPEIPVGISFEIFSRISVESLESLSCFDISEPFFKGHLILKETKDRFDIVDGRSDDGNVFGVSRHELVELLLVESEMMAENVVGGQSRVFFGFKDFFQRKK